MKTSPSGIIDHRYTTRCTHPAIAHWLEPEQCEGRAAEQELVARAVLKHLFLWSCGLDADADAATCLKSGNGGASQKRFSGCGNDETADPTAWKRWSRLAPVMKESGGVTPGNVGIVAVHAAGWTGSVGTGSFWHQGSECGKWKRCCVPRTEPAADRMGEAVEDFDSVALFDGFPGWEAESAQETVVDVEVEYWDWSHRRGTETHRTERRCRSACHTASDEQLRDSREVKSWLATDRGCEPWRHY